MEKRNTLTPRRRATQKWPNSCTVIKTPRATLNETMVSSNESMAYPNKANISQVIRGCRGRDIM